MVILLLKTLWWLYFWRPYGDIIIEDPMVTIFEDPIVTIFEDPIVTLFLKTL
jgi:hypothetical protein